MVVFSVMKRQVLNYRLIVEKEKTGKGEVFVAYAPSLGISDFGRSIEEAIANIEKAIKLYLETAAELGKTVPPPDSDEYFVTTRKIVLNSARTLCFS